MIAEIAERLGDPKPPSEATLCRWLARWKNSGERDLRVLVPNHSRRGNRTRRLPSEVVQVIEDAVDAIYLRRERTTLRDVWKKVRDQIVLRNAKRPEAEALPVPSERAIARRVAAIDRYEVKRARDGRQAADHEYRPVGSSPKTSRPLEVVEADHTRLDIILLSNEGIELGRPWLTAILDTYSRCPTGFYIGFERPSALSVSIALRNSITAKDDVADKYPDIQQRWPCHGVPETIRVDNAMEFHSAAFDDACAQLGILIQYAPVKSPWFKGKVERWLGTVARQLCHQLPGTTFSNVQQRGDYDSEGRARISIDLFLHLFHKWVIEIFILEWHGGLQGIPRQFWEEGTQEYPVRFPPQLRDLDALLGGVVERTLGRQGIELHGLHYNSEEVRRIRSHPATPRKVKVRYDPTNLSAVWIIHPITGCSVEIPSIEPDYTEGLTLFAHKAIRRRAAERSEGYVSVPDLCRARAEMQQLVDEALSDRRRRTRTRVARYLEMGGQEERSEQTIRDAAEFMGDAPRATGGPGVEAVSSSWPSEANQPRPRGRTPRGARAERVQAEKPTAAKGQWEDDDDDIIDPAAMGITSVPRR